MSTPNENVNYDNDHPMVGDQDERLGEENYQNDNVDYNNGDAGDDQGSVHVNISVHDDDMNPPMINPPPVYRPVDTAEHQAIINPPRQSPTRKPQTQRELLSLAKAISFDGTKDVSKFVKDFDDTATGCKLSASQALQLLRFALKDEAYDTCTTLPAEDDDNRTVSAWKAELLRRFGAEPHAAWTKATSLSLTESKNVDAFAVSIKKNLLQAFPHMDDRHRNEIARMLFLQGLAGKDDIRVATLRDSHDQPWANFEALVKAARRVFAKSDAETGIVAAKYSPHKPKEWHSSKKTQPQSFKKHGKYCQLCSKRGITNHETRDYRLLQEATKYNKKEVRYHSTGSMPTVRIKNSNFLLDSGSSHVLMTTNAIKDLMIDSQDFVEISPDTLSLKTVSGVVNSAKVFKDAILLDAICDIHEIIDRRSILTIGTIEIHGLLGVPWLRWQSPITFDDCEKCGLHVKSLEGEPIEHECGLQKITACATSATSGHTLQRMTSTLPTPIGFHETARIVESDFLARRITDGTTTYWTVRWFWKNGEAPSSTMRPPFYKKQIEALSADQLEKFHKEIQLWIDSGFVEQVEKDYLKGSITLMAVSQEHKTTPMRPVTDYSYLNQHIESQPNSDYKIDCPSILRKWRTKVKDETQLVDCRKAYMQVRIDEDQACYQGIILPDRDHKYYCLKRLAFGISIAPKVLTKILQYIFAEEKIEGVDSFIDDILLDSQILEKVTNALTRNGFPTKPPESARTARILGLQLSPNNTWKRREEITPLTGDTYTHLRSWIGGIVAHYPIMDWLRPAARAVERLAVLLNPKANKKDLIDHKVKEACNLLFQEIQTRGDPTTGVFTVDPTLPWTLYTDASNVGLGACLYFGKTKVEDVSWLRKSGDKRPIDIVELEAVLKGLNLVVSYWRALKITGQKKLRIAVDNTPTMYQLMRKQQEHWISSRGLTQGTAEVRLQIIEDTLATANCEIEVIYVKSEENPADSLTRFPDKIAKILKTVEAPTVVATTIGTDTWRQRSTIVGNYLVVEPDYIDQFLAEEHDHEGAEALFHKVRGWVRTNTSLLDACRRVTKKCEVCCKAKAHPGQTFDSIDGETGNKRARENAKDIQSTIPFNKLHLDIAGPYKYIDGKPSCYILTCVYSATGFALAKAKKCAPVGEDVVSLLKHIHSFYHTQPLVVCADNGSNLVSTRVKAYLNDKSIRLRTTAINSSKSNGKVERLHRTLNEYLRCHVPSPHIPIYKFFEYVTKALMYYNTTPFNKVSAHQRIFRYDPEIDNLKPIVLRPEYNLLCESNSHLWGPGLKVGTKILIKKIKKEGKLDQPYEVASVHSRVGSVNYMVQLSSGRIVKYHMDKIKFHPETEIDVPAFTNRSRCD